MYCMMKVVYGTFRNKKVNDAIDKMEDDPNSSWYEDDDGICGFIDLYSGASNVEPGFCGVELCEFDEATDCALDVNKLNFLPTAMQMVTAEKKYDKLDVKIKKVAPPLGVYIVFYTS